MFSSKDATQMFHYLHVKDWNRYHFCFSPTPAYGPWIKWKISNLDMAEKRVTDQKLFILGSLLISKNLNKTLPM